MSNPFHSVGELYRLKYHHLLKYMLLELISYDVFTVTESNEVFSGDQPYENEVSQPKMFADSLHFHHQGVTV
jgi:hypothetical protein